MGRVFVKILWRALSLPMLAAAFLAVALACAPALATNQGSVFDMADQFDRVDKQDFQEVINNANVCIRARDFSCGDEQLRKAAKLANGSQDKLALNTATQNLQAERQRVRDEETRREEARREEEQAEERRRRAEREEEESSSTASSGYGNAFMQGMQQSMNNYAAMNKIHNESMQNINRIVEEKKANERAAREQREREAREAAEFRAQERARQNAAAERRTQENERTRLALAQQEQTRQQEQARREEQAHQQEQARRQEQERAQQQERQRQREEQLAKDKAARQAAEAETCVLEGTGLCRGGAVTETRGGTFYVKQPNHCGYRLYVKICIKTKSGRDDCGSDSAEPGGSASYWHSSDDATGQFTVTSVGVLKGGNDWSCMGRKQGGD